MASGGDTTTTEMTEIPRSKKEGSRFVIPWGGFHLPSAASVAKFICTKSESAIPSQQELDRILPVLTPDAEKLSNPPADAVQVTWLGHATVLVQMEGVNFLTDPVFSEYCGPIHVYPVPKRYRRAPCTVDELPPIDAVVISHNHYDHLDVNSVEQLLKSKSGKTITWFVPLGLRQWMIDCHCPPDNVKELDWTEAARMANNRNNDMEFVFTPAQHWSKRGVRDTNKVLWGSWCVIGKKKKFYFAGDTGYCGVFKQIGEKYGPFDLAAIPIGAYKPRYVMVCQHIDPAEAWKIHKDVKAIRSLGIHWGTFNLSHEFYLEPKQIIEQNPENTETPQAFTTVNPGGTMTC